MTSTMLKRIVSLALTVLVYLAWVVGPAYAADNQVYVVQPGDTMLHIAAWHNLTATQLATANGLRWDAAVEPGQQLRVPDPDVQASPDQESGIYVVRPGDTLIGIAARHGVSVSQLASANGLRANSWVYVGQRLSIPGSSGPSAPSASTSGSTYIVRPGDTLVRIAARHRVTVSQLARANGLSTRSWVYVGQRLSIPGGSASAPSAPSTSPGGTYIVRPGDSLTKIAVRHGVSLSRLASVNGLRTNSWVYVGQRLHIPSGSSTPAPSTNPSQPASPPPSQSNAGKWIDINLSTQTLTAYSGQTAVFRTAVSTGTWRTPTVVGTFRVYVKYVSTRMRGPGYDLPNVPYTMYFYRGYGIHGTYWHNNFGTPMSHGCVNLPTDAARWVFNWAPVGTKVVTHY